MPILLITMERLATTTTMIMVTSAKDQASTQKIVEYMRRQIHRQARRKIRYTNRLFYGTTRRKHYCRRTGFHGPAWKEAIMRIYYHKQRSHLRGFHHRRVDLLARTQLEWRRVCRMKVGKMKFMDLFWCHGRYDSFLFWKKRFDQVNASSWIFVSCAGWVKQRTAFEKCLSANIKAMIMSKGIPSTSSGQGHLHKRNVQD